MRTARAIGSAGWRRWLAVAAARGARPRRAWCARSARIVRDVRRDGDAALVRLTRAASTACALAPDGAARAARRDPRPRARAPTPRVVAAAARAWRGGSRPSTGGSCGRGFRLRARDGSVLEERVRPLASVGLYVPGRRRRLPVVGAHERDPGARGRRARGSWSSRRRARSRRTPRWRRRSPSSASREHVYRVGGAQAIAALAYGTRTMPAVDKIVGPGNACVAAAKRLVRGQVEIDSEAGPERGRDPGRRHGRRRLRGRRPPGAGRARQRRRDGRAGDAVARAGAAEVVRLVARGPPLGGQPRERARRALAPARRRRPGARPRRGRRGRERAWRPSTPR